jgi:hypothetical protein
MRTPSNSGLRSLRRISSILASLTVIAIVAFAVAMMRADYNAYQRAIKANSQQKQQSITTVLSGRTDLN